MHDIWNPWHGCRKVSEGCENCYMFFLDEQHGNNGSEIYKTKAGFNKLDFFKQSILISYVNTVTLDVYKHWAADGKKVPIDEIVDICNQLVLSGTKGFFEKN